MTLVVGSGAAAWRHAVTGWGTRVREPAHHLCRLNSSPQTPHGLSGVTELDSKLLSPQTIAKRASTTY